MINLGYELDFELTKDAHFVALSGNLHILNKIALCYSGTTQ